MLPLIFIVRKEKTLAGRRKKKTSKKGISIAALVVAAAVTILSATDSGRKILNTAADYLGVSVSEELPAAMPQSGDDLQIYYFDIGQGDSELLRIPDGEGDSFDLLIDSGDADHTDEMLDYLSELKIDSLDAVVVTHPHADHMGSMAAILDKIEVESFYMPRIPDDLTPTTVSFEKMLDKLEEKGIGITAAEKGTVIPTTDLASVTVLSPEKGADYDNLNDFSAIIKVVFGDTSFLFTGDAEIPALKNLLNSGYDIDCDVLKVGHHGSVNGTNEKFLTAVSPDTAVISCGKDNRYGHPHKETVELLDKYSVETYVTYKDGTVVLVSDGKDIEKAA